MNSHDFCKAQKKTSPRSRRPGKEDGRFWDSWQIDDDDLGRPQGWTPGVSPLSSWNWPNPFPRRCTIESLSQPNQIFATMLREIHEIVTKKRRWGKKLLMTPGENRLTRGWGHIQGCQTQKFNHLCLCATTTRRKWKLTLGEKCQNNLKLPINILVLLDWCQVASLHRSVLSLFSDMSLMRIRQSQLLAAVVALTILVSSAVAAQDELFQCPRGECGQVESWFRIQGGKSVKMSWPDPRECSNFLGSIGGLFWLKEQLEKKRVWILRDLLGPSWMKLIA